MLVLLNLTVPPVVLLLLPAAVSGNYALPAPPADPDAVAAFTPGGEPLPTWVKDGRLYVLQGGDPATVIYVPMYENASGVYTVRIEAEQAVIQAPPGIMIEGVSPRPYHVEVNETGIYLYVSGPVTVTYYPLTVVVQPAQPAEQQAPTRETRQTQQEAAEQERPSAVEERGRVVEVVEEAVPAQPTQQPEAAKREQVKEVEKGGVLPLPLSIIITIIVVLVLASFVILVKRRS